MVTSDPIPGQTASTVSVRPDLLVKLASMPSSQFEQVVANLTSSFPAEGLVVATPDAVPPGSHGPIGIETVPSANPSWTLTAQDFVAAHQLAVKNEARGILILGGEAGSLGAHVLRDLANAVLAEEMDLAVPHYDLPPNAGMVNSAILYPLTRALFASRTRFPLAIDLGLSMRMAQRLAVAAQRFTAANNPEAPIWPINEAMVAGFSVGECAAGTRVLPQPAEPDLNTILPFVTGSLFSDIEAKAAFWQRTRQLPPLRHPNGVARSAPADAGADVNQMLQGFRLAYTNLLEIWSLVLPPNSLIGLKRLYRTDAAAFRMPEDLWARVVYDFVLGYRLRTINRGHLLGAMIPLYLAWVAGHINVIASGIDPESHVEATAAAFEAEKPYALSRWRWPDRFNP